MKKQKLFFTTQFSSTLMALSYLFLAICMPLANTFAQTYLTSNWEENHNSFSNKTYNPVPSIISNIEDKNIGFMFSPVISLDGVKTKQVPTIGLLFDKGIKNFMTVGVYLGYSRWDYLPGLGIGGNAVNQVSYGGRIMGYVFPIINGIAGSNIEVKNLEPYVGVMGGNVHFIYDDANTFDFNAAIFDIGPLIGVRYHFLKGMGIMAEVGQNVMGVNKVSVGLTFGH